MRKTQHLLIICCCLVGDLLAEEKFIEDFSQLVVSELIQNNIPGSAYVIVRGKNVLALETFGYTDFSKKHKINEDTVFRLASVSKPFTATITTMLAHENELKLTEPIKKYIPHFNLASFGSADKIQLRHILSHTTGLLPNSYDNLLHERWSMDKIIRRFDRITPICAPDQCYGYQNVAFGFLQYAIESSQSQSFSELLLDRIFRPLGMSNSSVGLASFYSNANRAEPHELQSYIKTGRYDSQGNEIRDYVWKKVQVNGDFYKVLPSAGINASISDLGKWLIANLGYQQDILSDDLLVELTTPRIQTKRELKRRYWRQYLTDAYYGYGWRIYHLDEVPVIYHSGWVSGFRVDIGYSPKLDIGFAIMINAESNVINKITSSFWAKAIESNTSSIDDL